MSRPRRAAPSQRSRLARTSLGRVGLPLSSAEMAARCWDAVVVGGGHNGLVAAAYLAGAGLGVLVLERRDRLGGACTLERPFEDPRYLVSPCAYVVGLLHPLVIDELGLDSLGLKVSLADPHLWCPLEDGSALALWDDDAKTAASVAAFSPGDVEGVLAYQGLFARIRRALREGPRDTWVGPAPDQAELEALLGHDPEALEVLLHEPIASVLERYLADQRLHTALHGQGLIGTWAGPRDPGTAGVHALHTMGTMGGRPGAWGFVEGGTGQVSFAIADAAISAGAQVAAGVEVSAIHPGLGVELEGGELVRARAVVSNADPVATLRLCGTEAAPDFARQVAAWRIEGPVIKLNCALAALPSWAARTEGPACRPHRAMVTISGEVDETQAAYRASRAGQPAPAWCELYFPTAYDPSLAPEGHHLMSVFAQYAPYRLAEGDWSGRREEVADAVIELIGRFSPDVGQLIEHRQVLAPPDIEAEIGLTGGHIFQGECLPSQMWHRRFGPRTSMPGVYLCGAATHPGGSVIGINGRNAAMAVLEDLNQPGSSSP